MTPDGVAGVGEVLNRLMRSGGDAGLIDPSLKLDDLVLEQAGDDGQLLWKLKAKKATYNRDKKEGEILDLSGELYQDGKPAFKISAKKGSILGDGKILMLKENIVALALKDGVELKGHWLSLGSWQQDVEDRSGAVHQPHRGFGPVLAFR